MNPCDAELITCITASEQLKLQQLICGEELGNSKPTQLLRQMQQLLGDLLSTSADNNFFVCELFLQRLPPNVRMVLTSTDITMELNKLADVCDKVMKVGTLTVSAVTYPNTSKVKELHQNSLPPG